MKMTNFLIILSFLLSNTAFSYWKLENPSIWVRPGVKVGDILPEASNNNVSIERFDNKLFMVWRTSKDHFASKHTVTHVAYSTDEGKKWIKDLSFSINADVREGLLKTIDGKLHLYYFEGGAEATAFNPKQVSHRIRLGDGKWTDPVAIAGKEEVLWEIKEHKGKMYKVSYQGPHYQFTPGIINVKFEESIDGSNWRPVDGARDSIVYRGGVSEVAFEFDDEGNLYGIGRNEDGDKTGWGTQVFTAKANHLSEWSSLNKSLPIRYDSPRMFKHHGEIFVLSRKTTKPFDRGYDFLPFNVRRWLYLGLYSLQTIRSAMFHFDTKKLDLDLVLDLPSAGDNAFPSVVPTDTNSFLVANYTSPLEHTEWSWIRGQKSSEGTLIYGVPLIWKPEEKKPSL
jgi:hypothetical protein